MKCTFPNMLFGLGRYYERQIALSLYGSGEFETLPMIDWRECLTSSFSRWIVKRCSRLQNTLNSSILANGSPAHSRGPTWNKWTYVTSQQFDCMYHITINYVLKLILKYIVLDPTLLFYNVVQTCNCMIYPCLSSRSHSVLIIGLKTVVWYRMSYLGI
mgnify:CR=1 FL=1